MPVPVRGRGRAPLGGAGLCRKVCGAPGGSTPDDSELDVVRENVDGACNDNCGFENVRDRWCVLASPTTAEALLAEVVS